MKKFSMHQDACNYAKANPGFVVIRSGEGWIVGERKAIDDLLNHHPGGQSEEIREQISCIDFHELHLGDTVKCLDFGVEGVITNITDSEVGPIFRILIENHSYGRQHFRVAAQYAKLQLVKRCKGKFDPELDYPKHKSKPMSDELWNAILYGDPSESELDDLLYG